MTPASALEDLSTALDPLANILQHDQRCQWRSHIVRCQAYARALKAEGFEVAKLAELSMPSPAQQSRHYGTCRT